LERWVKRGLVLVNRETRKKVILRDNFRGWKTLEIMEKERH